MINVVESCCCRAAGGQRAGRAGFVAAMDTVDSLGGCREWVMAFARSWEDGGDKAWLGCGRGAVGLAVYYLLMRIDRDWL